MTFGRRLVSEGLGTALLLAVVIGSGVMGERLSGGNTAIALLANAIATGAGLVALILMFGAISGAHFNPVVTLSEAWQNKLPRTEVLPYILVQIIGASHVWRAAVFCFRTCAYGDGTMVERIRGNLRPARSHHQSLT